MQKYFNNYAGATGIAIKGAEVIVTKADGSPAAIFSDNGVTPITSLLTGTTGEFEFYAANGTYTITLRKRGLKDEVVAGVQLYDPMDDGAAAVVFQPAGAGSVPRPVQDKLRENVSALDFGPLVASDITAASENRATINRAIAAVSAAGGGTVTIPAGVYFSGGNGGSAVSDKYIVMRGNVWLRGAGINATTIKRGSAASLFSNFPDAPTPVYGSGYSNIALSDMELDGNPGFSASAAANITYWYCSDNVKVQRVRFKDVPGLHAIDMNGCRDFLVEDIEVKGHDSALSLAFGGASYYPEAIQIAADTVGQTLVGLQCKRVTVRRAYFGPSENRGSVICAVGSHSAIAGDYSEDIVLDQIQVENPLRFGFRPFCWKRVKITNSYVKGGLYGVTLSSVANANDSFGVPSGQPQSGSDIEIRSVIFEEVTDFGIDIPPSHVGATLYKKWDSVSILNCEFNNSAAPNSTPINAKWVSRLNVDGLTLRGQFFRGISARFCDNFRLANYHIEGTQFEGVHVTETGETAYAGMGLSYAMFITGGTMRDIGYAGISISCALSGASIGSHVMTNIGAIASGKRPGVSLTAGAKDVNVSGVNVSGCSYGIDASVACSNVSIAANYVTAALNGPVRNLAIGSSSTVHMIGTGSATYNPPSLATGTSTTTTITVAGAALGDVAQATFSLDLQGIVVTASVSAADTVSVRFRNDTGATIDLASGTLRATVTRIT